MVDEFSPEVTHLVAACEEDGQCLRTMKYMQAILVGRWVVSFTCKSYLLFYFVTLKILQYVPLQPTSNSVELCRNYEYVMYVLSVKFKR